LPSSPAGCAMMHRSCVHLMLIVAPPRQNGTCAMWTGVWHQVTLAVPARRSKPVANWLSGWSTLVAPKLGWPACCCAAWPACAQLYNRSRCTTAISWTSPRFVSGRQSSPASSAPSHA
jgi:hypothetical protein